VRLPISLLYLSAQGPALLFLAAAKLGAQKKATNSSASPNVALQFILRNANVLGSAWAEVVQLKQCRKLLNSHFNNNLNAL
jgi:hypothetical protein